MWDLGPGFFEGWAGLTASARYGVAVVLLIVGAVPCYFTDGGYLLWGSWLIAGVLLLMFAARSKGE
ncbi:MAG: hypothetical protein ACYC35_17135 [Pirellulales bacterium]